MAAAVLAICSVAGAARAVRAVVLGLARRPRGLCGELSAGRCGRYPPPLAPAALLGLLGILGLAVALRLPAIEDNPANISIDELLPAMEARAHRQRAAPNVFSSVGWFTMPNLSFAFPALVMKVVGAVILRPAAVLDADGCCAASPVTSCWRAACSAIGQR